MASNEILPEVAYFARSQASEKKLYEGDGTSLSRRTRKAAANPKYQKAFLEALDLYEKVLTGSKRAAVDFSEAMTTSDFSFLFGDIIDRQMLASYQQAPVQWTTLARQGRVRDFRTVKRFTMDGAESVLEPVGEQSEYPAASLSDAEYEYKVGKFGRRVPLSWETLVNDDLDAFASIPQRLGNAARRSEEKFATGLYAKTAGPDSTFFSVANANRTDVQLTISGLQEAMRMLGEQTDADGDPIYIDAVTLVVPPALKVQANNIINATEILAASGGGNGVENDQLRVANWMRNDVSVIVNPWLPIIDQTTGSTAWYLFANPNTGRPAMEIGRLIGHESPELFQKSPNATRVGGGLVDPTDGDFDSDSVEWKVRHVMGGTLMDPKSALASTGTGS